MEHSSEDIYRILRRRIFQGKYAIGAALPSERDLADEFGASRMVLRTVLKKLLEKNYLEMVSPRKRRVPEKIGRPIFDPQSPMVGVIGMDSIVPGQPDKIFLSQRRLTGAHERLNELGYMTLYIAMSWSAETVVQYLSDYKTSRILYFNEDNVFPEPVRKNLFENIVGRIPVATFGDTCVLGESVEEINLSASDHFAGAEMIVENMASRGCRKLLWYYPFYNNFTLVWHQERQAGYEEAAKKFKVELIPISNRFPIINEISEERVFDKYCTVIAKQIKPYFQGESPVDGILCESDVSIPFFNRALKKIGKKPFAEIPVAGYDNYYKNNKPLLWEPIPPSVTIDKHDFEIGRHCVDLLFRRTEEAENAMTAVHDRIMPELVLPK